MIVFVFWFSIGMIAYVYVGYPLGLFLLGLILPNRKVSRRSIEPNVTLIISVYNEEATLDAKLKNTLALDYPKDHLEMLVVSDASSDKSDEITKHYEGDGIRLLRMPERGGKTVGLNEALRQAKGEIVLFSDANAMYEPDLVHKLVRNFADPKIGYVTGESRYMTSATSSVGVMENLYWTYEINVKKLESQLGSMVGADGAIYAIRKELYEPLQATDINDFVNPLQIIAKGFRGIYEPEAVCYEETASSFRGEFRRRVRIIGRSWRGLFRVSQLLNPFRYGAFSIALISHKLLRWLIPVMMMFAFLSNLALTGEGVLYQIFLGLQLLFLSFALVGVIFSVAQWKGKLFLFPYYICLANLASLIGIYKGLMGNTQSVWEPERQKARKRRMVKMTSALPLGLILLTIILSFGSKLLVKHDSISKYFFWGSAFFLTMVYAGYPLGLTLLTKIRKRSVEKKPFLPTVTLLVAAYNEEKVIEEKIQNALSLDYPKDKLKIMIASDGSTDQTNAIIQEYERDGILLHKYEPRRGKVSVLNRTIPVIESEITVLSDANTMYDPLAIKKLAENFADTSVGAVSGDVILENDDLYLGKSEGAYYRYERYLQEKETEVGCMVGVDGAMYAIRTQLFDAPSDNIILDDFVISMNIARQGYRVVYEPEAIAFESGSTTTKNEFKRKVRVIAGAIQAMKQGEGLPRFLNQPCFSMQFLFHKVMRWFVPIDLIVIFISNMTLLNEPFYQIAFVLQVIFYLIAIFAIFSNIEAKGLISIPFYFCMVNLAALLGIIKGLANLQPVTWEKVERG